jgi:hypothetical protein
MAPVYETLEAASLIALGNREEVLLQRDPAQMSLAEILHAVRQRRRGHRLLRVAALPEVAEVEKRILAAIDASVGHSTLAELAAQAPSRRG